MMFAEAVRRTHNNESVSYLFSNVPYVWPELPAAVAIKLFPSYDWNLRYFKNQCQRTWSQIYLETL